MSSEGSVPAGLYFRLLRRQKKNPASANATTARVAPTAIPATAPDDNSLLPLSLLLSELELEFPVDGSDVDVEVVSASEAVVPAVVAVLSPVDLGGYIPSANDPRISCVQLTAL